MSLFLPGLVLVLNTLDAISTVLATQYYGAIEANPLMDYLLELHPMVFVVVKVVLVNAVAAWAWSVAKPRRAFMIVAVLYSALIVSHAMLWPRLLGW